MTSLKKGNFHLQSPGGSGGELTLPALRPCPHGDVTRCDRVSRLRMLLLRNKMLRMGGGSNTEMSVLPAWRPGVQEPRVSSASSPCVQTSAFIGASALLDQGGDLPWMDGRQGSYKTPSPLLLPTSPSRVPGCLQLGAGSQDPAESPQTSSRAVSSGINVCCFPWCVSK